MAGNGALQCGGGPAPQSGSSRSSVLHTAMGRHGLTQVGLEEARELFPPYMYEPPGVSISVLIEAN